MNYECKTSVNDMQCKFWWCMDVRQDRIIFDANSDGCMYVW